MDLYDKHFKRQEVQRGKFSEMRKFLLPNDCMIVFDFKQNLSLGGTLVQYGRDFYNRPSRTCFGVVIIYRRHGQEKKIYFDLFSKCLSHSSAFVAHSLREVLTSSQFLDLKMKKATLWMDNAKHFKNQELAFAFVQISKELELDMDWNFFGEYHGKNICDARFSTISRSLERYVEIFPEFIIKDEDDIIRAIRHFDNSDPWHHSKYVQMVIEFDSLPINQSVLVMKGISNLYSFSFDREIDSVRARLTCADDTNVFHFPISKSKTLKRSDTSVSLGHPSVDYVEKDNETFVSMKKKEKQIKALLELSRKRKRTADLPSDSNKRICPSNEPSSLTESPFHLDLRDELEKSSFPNLKLSSRKRKRDDSDHGDGVHSSHPIDSYLHSFYIGEGLDMEIESE